MSNLTASFDYISGFIPLRITMKEFKEILSMDSQLEHEIFDYGGSTGERETFMSIWSAKYMDMAWPCYGDSSPEK